MSRFDLVIEAKTPAKRKSFLDQFNFSTRLHGKSYDISEKDGKFTLKLKPGAPTNAGIPRVYMDIHDFERLWKGPPSQPSSQLSGDQFGIYQSPEGELWIDGTWEKGDRNDRVKAAEIAYKNARIHASPHRVKGWEQIG